MQERPEMHIRSPSGEDPLEKEMATHSSILASILAWEIPWAEEAGRLMSMGVTKGQTQLSMNRVLGNSLDFLFFIKV